MAISSRKHYLLGRIKRIITNENKRLNVLEKLALLSGFFVFSAFTYINQQEEIVELGPKTTEQFTEPPALIIPNNKPQIQPGKDESKLIEMVSRPPIDTVPPKKKKVKPDIKVKTGKSLPAKKQSEAAKPDEKTVLKEIEQMKEQIGKKKESIGLKKAQLKEQEGKDKIKEKEIEKEIEMEREEIKTKRDELEKKREEFQNLKKKKETGKVDVQVPINKIVTGKIEYMPLKEVHFDLANKIKLANAPVITKDVKIEFNAKIDKQELQYKLDHKVDFKPRRIESKPRSLKAEPVKSAPKKTIQL